MDFKPEDVLELCAAGEGVRTEFKAGLPIAAKVARTLAAFANTRGGYLLIGVDDRGQPIGVKHWRRVAKELRQMANEWVEPPLAVQVQAIPVAERVVLVCSVPFSSKGPHGARDAQGQIQITLRMGSSSRNADGPALRRLKGNPDKKSGLSELERDILQWLERAAAARKVRVQGLGPQDFAAERNIGLVRARRAFLKLERSGRLIGYGTGKLRRYGLA